jgi:hypothetical protein
MPQFLVEVHVPPAPDPDVPGGDDQCPWTDAVEDCIAELDPLPYLHGSGIEPLWLSKLG